MAMTPITVAEYFPFDIQQKLPKEDWEACLDAWILICHEFLILNPTKFAIQASASPSLLTFLTSYVKEKVDHVRSSDLKSKSLRKKVFLLMHRLLSELNPAPPELLAFGFLSDLSVVYQVTPSLPGLLNQTWDDARLGDSISFKKHKGTLIQSLERYNATKGKDLAVKVLVRLAALLKSCYSYGQYLMAGSDVLDALSSAYSVAKADSREKLMVIVYRSLYSLIEPQAPKISALLDHLYSLKISSDSLLQVLCSETPLLRQIRAAVAGPEAARSDALMQQLSKWETPVRRKIRKGKGKEVDAYANGASGNIHVHQMSLITNVRDIFPDLGTAFVVKLLDEYENNVEQVTQHLLENSLPHHLRNQDRSENLSVYPTLRTLWL